MINHPTTMSHTQQSATARKLRGALIAEAHLLDGANQRAADAATKLAQTATDFQLALLAHALSKAGEIDPKA